MGDQSSLAPICFQRVNNINGKKITQKMITRIFLDIFMILLFFSLNLFETVNRFSLI